MDQEKILKEFQRLPGVGRSISKDIWDLGFRSLERLKSEDPEELYHRLCMLKGQKVDRCMLYVFRCIRYYLNENHPESQKLKWWYWKDQNTD
jgi:hypothetical protein